MPDKSCLVWYLHHCFDTAQTTHSILGWSVLGMSHGLTALACGSEMRFLLVHDSLRTAENLKGFFQEMYELFVKVGHVITS